MKVRLTIVVLLISFFSFGQTSYLRAAVAKLDKALIEKDTAILKQLLHDNVTYGHSNGWVETKADVLKDLTSGKLVYHTIKPDSSTWKTEVNWASRRSKTRVEVSLNGNRMDLNLHVLEVWLKTNKGWQLIARQSTKV